MIWKHADVKDDVKEKIEESMNLWKKLDVNKKLVIYSSGWGPKSFSSSKESKAKAIPLFASKFQKRDDVNFVVSLILLSNVY